MAREHEKSEWGEPGQPSEGGVMPEDNPSRGRSDKGRRRRQTPGTGGENGTPASNN